MGARDIAPKLHFVELGVKINGDEWLKVMDENIVPNGAWAWLALPPKAEFVTVILRPRIVPL